MKNQNRSTAVAIGAILIAVAFAAMMAACASQQTGSMMKTEAPPQIYGTPGSPSATMTFSGEQLPPLQPKFGGKIERSALQSTPWWPPRVVPPKGAPNVLLIMTDTGTSDRISITTVMSDWNVASAVDNARFTFTPPKGASPITFMPLETRSGSKS